MRRWICLSVALLVALLAGCAAPVRVSRDAPVVGAPPDVVGPALEAYRSAVAGPGDGEALRRAFDQVALALAVAPAGHGLRGELLAAEADLVGRLALLDAGHAQAPSAAGPTATALAAGPTATAPPAAPAATAPPAARPPAPARPVAPSYAVATRKSFEGSGNSGQFASCIDVQILGRGGPVGGAVIGMNNGDHSYQDQTDQNGYSGRCGLGASTWSVVVFWTPGGGQVGGAATTVYVSGAPEQRAAVVFRER